MDFGGGAFGGSSKYGSGINPFSSTGGSLGKNDVVGNAFDRANPYVSGARKSDDSAQKFKDSQNSQSDNMQKSLDQMKATGQGYYDQMNNAYTGPGGYQSSMNTATNKYLKDSGELQTQMEDQAKDSKATYSNNIVPKLKDQMETAQKNAAGAMTLQQAGDPNNDVATATRKMYGDQAQGINREGLADAGVLQAMGSQATAGQFGAAGGLMTGGQLQALQGANLGQSGAAMARAQGRANDLRQQGIQAGSNASAAQYNRGVDANNYYNNTIGNYQNGYQTMNDNQDKYRQNIGAGQQNIFGTTMGQANANLGIGTGLAGLKYGIDTQGQNRQLAFENDKAGVQQGQLINDINSQNEKTMAMSKGVGTVVGGVAGGMMGGPAGAAAGSQAGAGVGGMLGSQSQTSVPGRSNYGGNQAAAGGGGGFGGMGGMLPTSWGRNPGAGNGGTGYSTPDNMAPNAGASPYEAPAGAANGGATAGADPYSGGYDGGYNTMMNNPYAQR